MIQLKKRVLYNCSLFVELKLWNEAMEAKVHVSLSEFRILHTFCPHQDNTGTRPKILGLSWPFQDSWHLHVCVQGTITKWINGSQSNKWINCSQSTAMVLIVHWHFTSSGAVLTYHMYQSIAIQTFSSFPKLIKNLPTMWYRELHLLCTLLLLLL